MAPGNYRSSAISRIPKDWPRNAARACVALCPKSFAASNGARSSTSESAGMPWRTAVKPSGPAPIRDVRMWLYYSTRNAAGTRDVIRARPRDWISPGSLTTPLIFPITVSTNRALRWTRSRSEGATASITASSRSAAARR